MTKNNKDLQRAIVQCLKLRAKVGVVWFAVPGDRMLAARSDGHKKLLGVRADAPDLAFILHDRMPCFMQFARDGDPELMVSQFKSDMDAVGCGFAYVSNIDSALECLSDWGVL